MGGPGRAARPVDRGRCGRPGARGRRRAGATGGDLGPSVGGAVVDMDVYIAMHAGVRVGPARALCPGMHGHCHRPCTAAGAARPPATSTTVR